MTMDLLKPFGIFLKEGYSTTGLAHQYQLLSHLHCMRQEPGQSNNDFLSQSRGSPSVQRSDSCRYCHSPDHALLHCPIRVCKHCHKTGPGHYQDDCPRRNSGNTWSKGGHYKSGNRSKSSTASLPAA
ncbi:hypothetical protein U1Q18_041255 [Sarracenia purpurea var. burkii]